MNENTFSGLQESIKFKMEVLADMTGYSKNSIYRITGWAEDTQAHENLRLVLKTVKMGNLTITDLQDILYSLNKIQQQWEMRGF